MRNRNRNVEEVEQDEVVVDKFKKNFKHVLVVTGIAGGMYLLGGIKGYNLGFKMGQNLGQAKGYDEAMTDMAKIVREAKEKVE